MTRSIWTFALGFWILAFPPSTVRAQDPPRTITVTGNSEVSSQPDTALMTLGVTSEGATAAAALQANAKAMREVVEAVRSQGIEGRDVQTSSLSVQPRYRTGPKPADDRPAIVGYVASNQVRLRIRTLSMLGGLIDRVVAAGSNELQGLSFDVTERDRLKDEARRGAVRDATRKAQLYAAESGVKLGELVGITDEPVSVYPRPVAERVLAAAPVPVEPGEVALQAQIKMIWRIAP